MLVKFLGICSFLGVSRKLDQAVGMSAAVIFVMLMSTAVTWPIYHFLLDGGVNFVYMETVVFILVIAALVPAGGDRTEKVPPGSPRLLGRLPAPDHH